MAKRKIVCDTDVMIDYWDTKKVRHTVTKHIIDNIIGLDNVWISAITQMELLIGAFNKSELSKINKNIGGLSVIAINDSIVSKAIQLIKQYTLSHGLALPDALIAATSIQLELELFT